MQSFLARNPMAFAAVLLLAGLACAADPPHPLLTWVKRHPNPDAKTPSPRLGYETTYGYDPSTGLLIRHSGHNQGNGGEQNNETWLYNLEKDVWTLQEPNDAPPGVCCGQQNVFHLGLMRFLRFPSFAASHGWQSIREVRLHDSSVWSYDPARNHWQNLRPLPEPELRPLRGAAYDPYHEIVVIHGGETARHNTVIYDLYTNTWHWPEPKDPPPFNLSQPGFTYDSVNRVFVLFGSQFQSHPETWTYDVRRNEWKVLRTKNRPPFDKSSPILEADTRNGIVLASVKGKSDLETWALDVAKATWKKLDVKFQPAQNDEGSNGNRNRVMVYLPDKNLFVQEIRTRKEQQVWTFRYAEAPEPLPAPRQPKAKIAEDGKSVTLSWKAPATGNVTYNVYRAVGEHSWQLDWQPAARNVKETTWTDRHVKPNTLTWYRVHAVTADGKEGPGAPLVRTQPAIVSTLHVSVLGPRNVEIAWDPSPSEDVVGYHVERAEVQVYSTDQVKAIKQRLKPTSDLAVGHIRQIGPFRRLTDQPLAATRFTDRTIDLAAGQPASLPAPIHQRDLRADQLEADGKPYRFAVYAYRLRAVNRLGVASGPSPAAFTIPSAVEHVFSREEGKAATHLKWQANPEQKLQGYFVYRHDGRFSQSPIVRLTAKPITATTFTDPQSGPPTRRYEIVAVDVLGQEGIPSQPVWSRREWQSFYVPYTKEWHQ